MLSDAAAALDKGKAAEDIMRHVARNKVAYKHLKGGVEFVDIIPKNPSGTWVIHPLWNKSLTPTSRRQAT